MPRRENFVGNKILMEKFASGSCEKSYLGARVWPAQHCLCNSFSCGLVLAAPLSYFGDRRRYFLTHFRRPNRHLAYLGEVAVRLLACAPGNAFGSPNLCGLAEAVDPCRVRRNHVERHDQKKEVGNGSSARRAVAVASQLETSMS